MITHSPAAVKRFLQGIHQVEELFVELLLDLQRLFNGHVHNLALLHTDNLIADAVPQQPNGQVAGFESESAVACGGLCAALHIPDHVRAGFHHAAHPLHDGSKAHGAHRFFRIAGLAVRGQEAVQVERRHGFPAAFRYDDRGAGGPPV